MKQLIGNFKKYKFLLYELIKKDIKLKYRRSYLGIFWTLLEPLLTMIVLAIVFGGFYGKSDKQFPVYILTGRLLFAFFNSGTKSACKSIQGHASMIKKVYIPKYIYPVASILSNFIIFLISLIVLIGVAAYFRVQPTGYLVQAIIPLILLLLLTMGVGMILATLCVFFRDLEYLWSVVCMFIMYASAIFYDPAKVVTRGYGWVLDINPVYAAICNFRHAIYGEPMDMEKFIYLLVVSVVSMIVGFVLFYKKQDDFILHI